MQVHARVRAAAVAAVAGLAVWGLAPATAAASGTRDPLAVTRTGVVRGASADGVDSFLGIPYAAPPVGDLRFATPRPAARWHGVRDATTWGNRCPAAASSNGPRSETEDCLFVNVQRPSRARAGARLPVLVFIHGGGLTNGSSNQMDMSKIVRETGVVGVTMNYRLGALGFLGAPGLTAEGAGESGNYGFADQQAALQWVRRNVAAFGGDPRRVTIDGESAGGLSVCGHLAAPASRGLFAGAMIQSGSCSSRPVAATEAAGATYAAAVGCTDPATAPACLRALPVGTLLDAPYQPSLTSGTPSLPVDPAEAVRTGRFARVPVVNGANLDEGRTFLAGLVGQGRAQYEGLVGGLFGADAPAVLAEYPWPASGADQFTAAYLGSAVFTDSGFLGGIGGCGTRDLTRELARWTRTYQYEFAHRTGPGLTPIEGYVWGAGHAAELAYLWPSFDNGTPIAPTFDAGERRLAREMVQWWGAFTERGTPWVAGQAPWPSYDRTGLTLSLRAGGRSTLLTDARYRAEHHCDFWAELRG
jgi:para-nitrobenzyl esterase